MRNGVELYGALLLAGFGATYAWRFLGVMAVKRIDPESEMLLWVRAVATALVAALVMRISFSPAGVLAETAVMSRAAGLAAGVAVFLLLGRRVERGVAAAVMTFALVEIVFMPLL